MTIAFIFRCGRRRCRRGEASGKYRQDERFHVTFQFDRDLKSAEPQPANGCSLTRLDSIKR
jgi:hypothetical protein